MEMEDLQNLVKVLPSHRDMNSTEVGHLGEGVGDHAWFVVSDTSRSGPIS